MFSVGDTVTTTVYMIGGRSAEVSGPVVALRMARKTPGRVVAYEVDATAAGYGVLSVDVDKARAATVGRWYLEPFMSAGPTYGPYGDEVEASEAMEDLGLSDETYKLARS